MSADIIRRATALMRDTYQQEFVDEPGTAEWVLAVADWLDRAADEPWCCEGDKWDPEWNNWVLPALTVARAYLGEES